MSGIALSHGSILEVFKGKRAYQPVWQVIYTYLPSGQSQQHAAYGSGSQLLLSDGQYLTYNVALHPHCTVTYNKNAWKGQNSGRSPEDILSSYRFPTIKVMDLIRREGDQCTVLFLSKVKLMGWEADHKMPPILRQSDVEVVLGTSEVVLRSREGLENFEDYQGPTIEMCEEDDGGSAGERAIDFGGVGGQLLPSQPEHPAVMHKFNDTDLESGVLAPLGPRGLDILRLCAKCRLLTYHSESRVSSFKPPTSSLVGEMKKILPIKKDFEFCSCDDENEQFRKEFQNKCMVVNQDVGPGSDKKVQCILVSKDQTRCPEHFHSGGPGVREGVRVARSEHPVKSVDGGIKELTLSSQPSVRAMPRVSARLRQCERCGVEDTMMTACRQCSKVWYCSPACKRADVHQHSVVCRAHITVRRHGEERAEFAGRLREPEDGCGNCGFWRDSLEPCARCASVAYCCYRCKDKAAERHRPVCEAFSTIQTYKLKKDLALRQEVD